MNPRQPKLLLALAIALFAYISVYERPAGWDEKVEQEESLLLPTVNAVAVNRVEFNVTNSTVAVELRNHRWRMVRPSEYPAYKVFIQLLLRACSELKSSLTIPPEEITSLSDFGLNPPRGTLTIFQGAEKIRLKVGAVTPLNHRLYVQPEGSTEVFVVDGGFADYLPFQYTRWRSPYLLDMDGLEFDRVRIRHKNNVTMFERGTNARWRITQPPPPKRGNSEIIERVVERFKKWQVAGFVNDRKDTPLEKWGLEKPVVELNLSQGTNQLLSVEFGGSEQTVTNSVYARLPMNDDVVLADASPLILLMQNYWSYCDHRMIDPFQEEQIDVIEVEGPESFSLRRRTNGIWQAQNKQRTLIDPQLMRHFLETLDEMKAVKLEKQVVTDYKQYGLDKPWLAYRLFRSVTNATGQSTNVFVGGIEFGKADVDTLFARRHDENTVYVVALGQQRSLPQSLFQIRSRMLWSFLPKNAAGITVFNNVKTNHLVRRGGGTGARWGIRGTNGITDIDVFENEVTEEALHELSMLTAARWVSRGTNRFGPYKIGQHFGGLTIEMATPPGQNHTVLFGIQPNLRNPYAAFRDPLVGEWVVFEFPASIYSKYILPYLSIKDQ